MEAICNMTSRFCFILIAVVSIYFCKSKFIIVVVVVVVIIINIIIIIIIIIIIPNVVIAVVIGFV